jgi:diamine N-acetyltransferase
MAAKPYTAETFALGRSRAGLPITLAPMTRAAADVLGPACAAIGPWQVYGMAGDRLADAMARDVAGEMTYQVLVGGARAGAVMIRHPWLIGPYLAMLAVLPAFQGQAVGDAVLRWYEARAREGGLRNIWLCVSGFNDGAQRFYRAHGWEQTAVIPGMVVDGVDELLMRKVLG